MKFQFNVYILGLMSIAFLFMNCNKDGIQAEDSIKGEWEVVEITSIYGEFSENGFNPSETISEEGSLGIFQFSEDSVTYEFTRNDSIYTGSDSWDIMSKKVNAGFTKETKFVLNIKNHFLFNVVFGNDTKNSEKNAKEATFITYPDNGFGVFIELSLEKN